MKAKDLYSSSYIQVGLNYVHETAIIGENVKLGKGNVIMPYAVIGETGFIRDSDSHKGSVVIGDNNKIGCHACIMSGEKGRTIIGNDNMIMNFANVGHDVKIRNNCEIGPGVIIGGFSTIWDNVKIKIGALIRNRINIDGNSLIGMGAVVIKDIPPYQTVIGNPGKCV